MVVIYESAMFKSIGCCCVLLRAGVSSSMFPTSKLSTVFHRVNFFLYKMVTSGNQLVTSKFTLTGYRFFFVFIFIFI